MSSIYSVAGRTAATSGATNDVACALWNPHGSLPLAVRQIFITATTAGAPGINVRRITARGTASTTVTPNLDNSYDRRDAPATGALLDLAYSVQPTIVDSGVSTSCMASDMVGEIGTGIMFPFPFPITVPAGTGLALISTGTTVIPVSDVYFEFEDPASYDGPVYYCGGQTNATSATAPIAHLWNPSSTRSLMVFLIGMTRRSTGTATDTMKVERTSTRGTGAATHTPNSNQHVTRRSAPASGAVIDIANFSVSPTQQVGQLFQQIQQLRGQSGFLWTVPTEGVDGFIDISKCIEVPPSTGILIEFTASITSEGREFNFGWID